MVTRVPTFVPGLAGPLQMLDEVCLKDRLWVLVEHGASERGVLVPGTALRPASPQCLWNIPQRPLGKRHEIDWMAPAIHLFPADRGGEHGHD